MAQNNGLNLIRFGFMLLERFSLVTLNHSNVVFTLPRATIAIPYERILSNSDRATLSPGIEYIGLLILHRMALIPSYVRNPNDLFNIAVKISSLKSVDSEIRVDLFTDLPFLVNQTNFKLL